MLGAALSGDKQADSKEHGRGNVQDDVLSQKGHESLSTLSIPVHADGQGHGEKEGGKPEDVDSVSVIP